MKNINVRFANGKYVRLSELESKFDLSFSSYLVLGNQLIALDGTKDRLLVWNTKGALNQSYVIELSKVAAVSVEKSYGSPRPEESYVSGSEDFVKMIGLQFEYRSNEVIVLPFYDCDIDEIRELPRLERSAKDWQLILSKLAGSQANKTGKEKGRLLYRPEKATGSNSRQKNEKV
jgi:hypothetical protein